MDQIPASQSTPPGVKIRPLVTGDRLQIAFTWEGQECRELLALCPINKSSIARAASLRDEIRRKIKEGSFVYGDYFPESPRAASPLKSSTLMESLLQKQLDTYARQVTNGQMSPSTFNGYAKAVTGERMRRWHGLQIREVTPSLLRDWVSEMDCTSKAIRNMLIPLRSVMEDALNDELIEFNPFDRIALVEDITRLFLFSKTNIGGCNRIRAAQWKFFESVFSFGVGDCSGSKPCGLVPDLDGSTDQSGILIIDHRTGICHLRDSLR